jgi:hypothetical protein
VANALTATLRSAPTTLVRWTFDRRSDGPPIEIVGVSLLHTGWGITLLFSGEPLSISSLAVWGGLPVAHEIIGIYFLCAAILAVMGTVRPRTASLRLLLWQAPQWSILIASLAGSMNAVAVSHFAAVPHVEVAREAILARALYPVIVFLIYGIAWVRFAAPMFADREAANGQ